MRCGERRNVTASSEPVLVVTTISERVLVARQMSVGYGNVSVIKDPDPCWARRGGRVAWRQRSRKDHRGSSGFSELSWAEAE